MGSDGAVPVVDGVRGHVWSRPVPNAGLGAGDNTTGAGGMYATGDQPWAMFGTAEEHHEPLRAAQSAITGGDVDLGTGYLNAPHRYRIEWRTGNVVEFFIDGVSVNSRTASFGAITMRPGISDYNSGGPSLSVDWITQTPYISPCAFTSRVIDAGQLAHWIDLSQTGATPAGTSVGFETRTGNTATPDGTWSGWQSTTGATASPNGRYIQYRATLASADPRADAGD